MTTVEGLEVRVYRIPAADQPEERWGRGVSATTATGVTVRA